VAASGLAFGFLASRMTTREYVAGFKSAFCRRTRLSQSVLLFVLHLMVFWQPEIDRGRKVENLISTNKINGFMSVRSNRK
jgi:hypothetical protein